MAIIKSGSSTDELAIDPTSKAAHMTVYDTAGNAVGTSLAGLNRALNTAGFLRDSQFDYDASISVFGEQLVAQKIWLVGQSATDPLNGAQWSTLIGSSGAVTTTSGAFVLTTGTAANGSALLRSVSRAAVLAGSTNAFYCGLQLADTGTANNEKRWGIGDAIDGIDFSLQGGIISHITRVNSIETRSNVWTVRAPSIDLNPHIYTIIWAQGGYTLLQDGQLLTQVLSGAIFTNPNFQLTLSNSNTGGLTTPIMMTCVGMAAYRIGAPDGAVTVSNFPAIQPVTGNVTVTSLPAVTVSNFPVTQPVSLASSPLPTNAATESGHLASIDTKLTGPLAVTGAFFQATQPVSGTVTATQSTAANLAATVTQGPAGATAWKVDGSAVTQPVSVGNFPASQAVTGTFFQATQPVSIAGTSSVSVSNFPATQPVSIAATLPVSAASLPLPTGAATDANLTARLPTAANGALQVTTVDGFKATYAAGTASLALAAAATDVFTLYGSATKTIRITGICVSFIATTAVSVPVSLIKRSAVNTAGTSTAQAATSYDSNNAAATATCLTYTANPTALGAAVGTVLIAAKVAAPLTGGTEPASAFTFGLGARQAIVLRGTTQGLAINLNGATIVGGSAAISIEWTEE